MTRSVSTVTGVTGADLRPEAVGRAPL